MIDSPNLDFSFSGLKTALLYDIKQNPNYKLLITNYAHEFQQAVVDVLIKKTVKATKKYNAKTVMLSGGVAANNELRKQMTEIFTKQFPDLRFTIPDLRYTTDNAAMIAAAGYFKALRKDFTPWQKLLVDCNLSL
jgi:N6-L-threonylcarbamoyladenine synthase